MTELFNESILDVVQLARSVRQVTVYRRHAAELRQPIFGESVGVSSVYKWL